MNKAIIISSIFSIVLLSACGGGGSNNNIDDDENIGGNTNNNDNNNNNNNNNNLPLEGGVNGLNPITKLTLKQPRTVQVGSRTVLYTSEGGFEGDIQYVKQTYANGMSNEVFSLANNPNGLNIKDVQRELSADYVCDDGSDIRIKISSDFSSGKVVTTGKHNGFSISCASDFAPSLPINIFDQQSITNLLKGWGSNYATALRTTCNHQIEDMNGFSKKCTGEEITNYKITDQTGKIHKVTTKLSFDE